MTEEMNAGAAGENVQVEEVGAIAPNAIEVVLSFDLDRRTISISELESVAAGYTFSLSCSMTSPVTVRANGKPIALGRLVNMNGTVGVEIVQAL